MLFENLTANFGYNLTNKEKIMGKLPESRKKDIIPSLAGHLLHQGKVRNTYCHPFDGSLLIQQATNGISAFDFVFDAEIPRKGEVLTALTDFARRTYLDGIPHHFVESEKYAGRNAILDLEKLFPDIPLGMTFVVKKAAVLPYELIFRHHIGGSVWKEYSAQGTAGGNTLPEGLKKWQALERPIFTPSTKEESGHDMNISAGRFFEETGVEGAPASSLVFEAYARAYEYCRSRGILILDTKGEVGRPLNKSGDWMIIDEILTPDSSRYVLVDDLERALAAGKEPDFYDKEVFRIWAKSVETPFMDDDGKKIVGVNKLDPCNDEHVAFVHGLQVPRDVTMETAERYLCLPKFITGIPLYDYQGENLF